MNNKKRAWKVQFLSQSVNISLENATCTINGTTVLFDDIRIHIHQAIKQEIIKLFFVKLKSLMYIPDSKEWSVDVSVFGQKKRKRYIFKDWSVNKSGLKGLVKGGGEIYL